MCIAPAEPLSDGAAKFAFELDIVGSMLGAVCNTCSDTYCGALTANELFRLEFLRILLILSISFCLISAIIHTTKVRCFAFVALIISKFEHCIFLELVVEMIIRVFKTIMLVDPFEFGSLKRLLFHIFFDLC